MNIQHLRQLHHDAYQSNVVWVPDPARELAARLETALPHLLDIAEAARRVADVVDDYGTAEHELLDLGQALNRLEQQQ